MPYITPVKLLRSLVYNKRPNPANLLDGQPAYNGNVAQPGLFLKNSVNGLTKIGPIFVGPVPPNDPSDPLGAGNGSYSLGESWLDTSDVGTIGAILKVWDGSGWVECSSSGTSVSVSSTAPSTNLPEGSLWWNPSGTLSILYNNSWISISSNGDIDGGSY